MMEPQDTLSQRSETQCFSGDEDKEADLSLDQDLEDSGVITPTRKKEIKVKRENVWQKKRQYDLERRQEKQEGLRWKKVLRNDT